MDIRSLLSQFTGVAPPQQEPTGGGPPEPYLQHDNRMMKQWASDPNVLNQLGGQMMGIKGEWPVKTIGRETSAEAAEKWANQVGSNVDRFAPANENMSVNPHTEKLRQFIESHDIPARVDAHDNIWALDTQYRTNEPPIRNWVRLHPNLNAIKTWLGY